MGLSHRLCQLPRSREDHARFSSRDQSSGNTASKPLFPKLLENARKLPLLTLGEYLRGAAPFTAHAHIEGAIVSKAKTSGGIIELGGRNAEIHQHAIKPPALKMGRQGLGQGAEGAGHHGNARVFCSERPGGSQRFRIAVEGEEARRGPEARKQRPTVTAPTKGGIENPGCRPRRRQGKHLLKHHRDMGIPPILFSAPVH
jgi:hypothetical protein